MRLKLLFVFCVSFILMGCVAVKRSLDNYEACKGDPVCVDQMESARVASYTVTKAATGPMFPSGSEVAALFVSGLVAFGVGVWKGKTKG